MATEAELQAQAEGGQAGLAAFNRAASEINNRRAESIAGAMEGTSNRGAGAAADAAVQQIINAPVNRRLDDINQASATFTADMARLDNAQGAYMAGARQFGSRAAIEQRERAAAEARRKALEDELFNRYGGYDSATEYENAVTAGAEALRQQTYEDAKNSYKVGDRENDRQAASYAAQSANYDLRQRLEAERDARGGGSVTRASAAPQAIAQRQAAESAYQAGAAQREANRQAALQATNEFEAQRASRLSALRALVGQDMSLYAGRGPAQADPFARADGLSGGSVMDPRNLYEFQRDFAINTLGADPLDAMGRFAPLSELEAMEFEMDQANARQQFLEQQQYGPEGMAAARAQAVAEATGGLDVGAIASDANVTEDTVANYVTSPGFMETAAAIADGDEAAIDAVQQDAIAQAILASIISTLFPESDYGLDF